MKRNEADVKNMMPIRPGVVTLLSGPAKSGKSILSEMLVWQLAAEGVPVTYWGRSFVQGEMQSRAYHRMMLAPDKSVIDIKNMPFGYCGKILDVYPYLKWPKLVDKYCHPYVLNDVLRCVDHSSILIVDSLSQIEPEWETKEDIERIRAFQEWAFDGNRPVILVCQTSDPQVFTDVVDIVVSVGRDEDGVCHLETVKDAYNQRIEKKLWYDEKYYRFTEVT